MPDTIPPPLLSRRAQEPPLPWETNGRCLRRGGGYGGYFGRGRRHFALHTRCLWLRPVRRQRRLSTWSGLAQRSWSPPRPPPFQQPRHLKEGQPERPCPFASGEASGSERPRLPPQVSPQPTHPVRQYTAWHREVCGDVAVTPAVYKSAVQQRAVIWGQISARRLHPTRLHHGRHGSRQ